MALQLKLRPGERVILGGAVVRNGASRARLRIENDIPVLRESDILSPRAVRTPCERLYLAIQLAYLDPVHAASHLAAYHQMAAEVMAAAPSSREPIGAVNLHLDAQEYYRALKSARTLLSWEKERLPRVP